STRNDTHASAAPAHPELPGNASLTLDAVPRVALNRTSVHSCLDPFVAEAPAGEVAASPVVLRARASDVRCRAHGSHDCPLVALPIPSRQENSSLEYLDR